MKKWFLIALVLLFLPAIGLAGSTTNFGWDYGTEGQSPWWTVWTGIFTSIDSDVYKVKYPVEYNNGTVTTTLTILPTNGASQKLTLGGNVAISFTQPATGTLKVMIKIIQATGATHYTPTWSSVTWLGSGVAPTMAQTDGAIDFVGCYLDGSATYCMASH